MPAITKQDNVCLHDDSMPASMIRIIYDTMGLKTFMKLNLNSYEILNCSFTKVLATLWFVSKGCGIE